MSSSAAIRAAIGAIPGDLDALAKIPYLLPVVRLLIRIESPDVRDQLAQLLADALGIDVRVVHYECRYARSMEQQRRQLA